MMLLDILGSKKRLQILKLLSKEDQYVSQIMKKLKMDGKNTKHHLDTLEKTNIITTYPQGRKKYYKLNREIQLKITPPPEGTFQLLTLTNNKQQTTKK
ncbi:winged helix-turn-helix domain-containing protein [Methanonatronarchaeum sp. AMET-Sl]|uniref:ArsR/SmtB family transcription factor n=1 Tax=Methanonatronarchaeum sp. AMET-Sl TaxID=3037654 RepID=UPI00244E2F45|nr:winged helix-turn-helix domain-containing protein [Methanonatronarchaeum sp. AMET-Sl]WGI18024.1 winged helix-turn-helix domain-containing protein [Methanonatronarchaeum sp. AMET-Sl]